VPNIRRVLIECLYVSLDVLSGGKLLRDKILFELERVVGAIANAIF